MIYGIRRVRIMMIFMAAFRMSAAEAQDSSYVPPIIVGGECPCDFNVDYEVINVSLFANLKITVEEASTASHNDFYVFVQTRPGSEPIRINFFEERIPEPGENWTIGPISPLDKVDFRIFSEVIADGWTCDANRWGAISSFGFGHYKISFEDFCDFDWNDLIIDISPIPAVATVTITTPADLTSFVTDDASTFKVHAEGWATDMNGADISRFIDWFVLPNSNSGSCQPNTRQDSRIFDFAARNIPSRDQRGLGRLKYNIFAMSTPYFIPIIDLNVLTQDDIDTVQQQYVDYSLKLPYKYRFELTGGHAIIPTEAILETVFSEVCPCYRDWAGNANARCVLTSTFRSPDRNRSPEINGRWNSLHQYGLAIDIGYGDYKNPGKKDDSQAVWQCVADLGYQQIFPAQHPELSYNHVHIQNYHYRTMPYVER